MSQSCLAVAVLLTALVQVSRTLPISPNHRFAVFTPYWHQNSQLRTPEFLDKRPNCEGDPCSLSPQSSTDDLPFASVKRNNNNLYKTGWTMGGLPFSVIYMNPKPQITVRSPVAEPLQALAHSYDNAEPVDYPPETNRADPTVRPSRRQYSSIPQLFVSYGWGPLGK